ncbi:FAD-binding protein [Streptomyces sp. Inha503]|uniref:FAD-binding protein n=1 Tax=Streptomyces sp. Inha503 TaxID=3383314 RepID=UPI0039A1861C
MSATPSAPGPGPKEPDTTPWDEVVDILVAGSGAAGMVGAITAHDAGLSSLVVEKAAVFGGSTAPGPR